jgi:hypothetical protein
LILAGPFPASSGFLDHLSFIPAVILLLRMERIPAAHLLVLVIVKEFPITPFMTCGRNLFKFSVQTFAAVGTTIEEIDISIAFTFRRTDRNLFRLF